MSTLVSSPRWSVASSRTRLQLVPAPLTARSHEQEPVPTPPERTPKASPPAPVLVVGSDERARGRMLEELRSLLPQSTRFLEAWETWQVLAGAADSRMVVLTDDLGDVSAESLVRMLGRRHPSLPVLAVGERACAGGPDAQDRLSPR